MAERLRESGYTVTKNTEPTEKTPGNLVSKSVTRVEFAGSEEDGTR
ncbi:hypothetical protein GCM10010532_011260 [Dactylosporangium siamense]|uniref:Uncharacterized protein n=1 Tax=Dactylosporangium siamense TaxID=685454 RepID=A0A919PGV3_9ACTN|nr:hypothetical protein Dsi01nite_010370 [Dactylosporangium siamense]